jgi:hypothetical protein
MQILSVSNDGYLSVIGLLFSPEEKMARHDPRCFRAVAMNLKIAD